MLMLEVRCDDTHCRAPRVIVINWPAALLLTCQLDLFHPLPIDTVAQQFSYLRAKVAAIGLTCRLSSIGALRASFGRRGARLIDLDSAALGADRQASTIIIQMSEHWPEIGDTDNYTLGPCIDAIGAGRR